MHMPTELGSGYSRQRLARLDTVTRLYHMNAVHQVAIGENRESATPVKHLPTKVMFSPLTFGRK